MHEVWVTGIGMLSAVGNGPGAHLEAARVARSGIVRRTFFNGAAPDPVACGMIPADILTDNLDSTASDRADRVLERIMCQALDQAGDISRAKLECVVGTTLGNLHGATRYYREVRGGEAGDIALVKHFITSAPATAACKALGIGGRRRTISSACGSGTAAIGMGYNRVRSGACDTVICGGVDVLSPFVVAGFNSLRLVSARECRPFDRDRDGLNPGEGGAALVLESADSARRRGAKALAIIEGFGEALDAYHHTRAHPEGAGLVAAVRKAVRTASGGLDSVGHVHLHGTGTQANDMSEYAACRALFGENLGAIPACSTKSMTGHTFGGAGALSAAFCVLTLTHGVVPPTLFLETIDPTFAALQVSPRPRERVDAARALSLTLGFGGEAFALVLGRAP